MRWQNVTLPPVSEHPQRMLVSQLISPQSQFNAEQSHQMAQCHLSAWFCFPRWLWSPSSKKPESCFDKRVKPTKRQHLQRMLVPQLTRPQFQFNAEQSHEMARCHLSPWFCFLQRLWWPSSEKTESCFVQRVNSREGCWHHSWQDHDPSLLHTNQQTTSPIVL